MTSIRGIDVRLRRFSISLACLASACSGADDGISAAVARQLDSPSANRVDLSLVGPRAWDRVCVLKPYTDNRAAELVLGVDWNAEAKTSIASSDGINVLVFLQGKEVVAFTEHPRSKGDFSQVEPACFARSRAVFSRQAGGNGWVYLVASHAS